MNGSGERPVTVFLCGDVMTARGIDQIMPHPSDPRLHEGWVSDARTYVALAAGANGPIPQPVELSYIWGEALAELQGLGPDVRIVNLETSVTVSDQPWPKGINYRMHPANVGCLKAAGVDVCVLANNHVLDYGPSWFIETLDTLKGAGLKTAGAGRTLAEAGRPAVVEVTGDCRVVVHGFGTQSSGIPPCWAATDDCPGVNLLADLSDETVGTIEERIRDIKRCRDVTIASIHWGSNWGYDVPREHVRFARRLIDSGVDIVHGHSSHHPRPVEVYRNRLILYGCGDLINDYEGIRGYEHYRDDLVLMYCATLNPTSGGLIQLRMTPMQVRKMRLNRAAPEDVQWLANRLARINMGFGVGVEVVEAGSLLLRW